MTVEFKPDDANALIIDLQTVIKKHKKERGMDNNMVVPLLGTLIISPLIHITGLEGDQLDRAIKSIMDVSKKLCEMSTAIEKEDGEMPTEKDIDEAFKKGKEKQKKAPDLMGEAMQTCSEEFIREIQRCVAAGRATLNNETIIYSLMGVALQLVKNECEDPEERKEVFINAALKLLEEFS